MMRRYWIGYRVEILESSKSFTLHATYASCTNASFRRVRTPLHWRLPVPESPARVPTPFGASETLGIFGGKQDRAKHLLSEAVERAIGDCTLFLLLEILEENQDRPAVVHVSGPAFPKAVGRIAAIRPPRQVSILWVTPNPCSPFIFGAGCDPLAIIPPYPVLSKGDHGSEPWEDEPLVTGARIERCGSELIIQKLQMWNAQATTSSLQPLLDETKESEWAKDSSDTTGMIAHRDALVALNFTRTEVFDQPFPEDVPSSEVRFIPGMDITNQKPIHVAPSKKGSSRLHPYRWL